MASNQINFKIGYTVDKAGLSDLKKSLGEIEKAFSNMPKDASKSMKSSFKEAAEAAKELGNILDDAWNSNLGQLNLNKVNDGIKNTFGSVTQLRNSLEQSGQVGSKAYNKFASDVLNTNLQLKTSNKLLDDMATSMSNTVKWGITSSIFNNMTGSIQKAYYFVKDLDTSLNDIRIVTGKSADEMNSFAEEANKAAKSLAAGTTDYTNAALIYYQQGLADAEVKERTDITLKAANVTGQSAAEVSEQLTAVWNGYKVTADEAELYVDKLAAVAATTASDLEELSTGMSKVASAANSMGVDVDQLNAQIATIISVTRQAPESVGTALKTIYARMGDLAIDGEDEFGTTLGDVSGKMKQMGIEVTDESGNLRDMGTVIEEVAAKWDTWTEAQKQAAAVAMAGKRQYNNLVALFDNWDMYTESIETSKNAMGALQEQEDIYLESTRAHLQQLATEAENTYSILLNPETINGFTDALTGLLGQFNDFIGGLGGGANAFAYFGSVAMNVFSQQIARGINDSIKNVQTLKNNLDSIDLKNKIIDDIQVRHAASGENVSSNSAIEKEAAIQKEILRVRKALSSEQYNELTAEQQKIGILEQQIQDIESYKDIAKEIFNNAEATNSQYKVEINDRKSLLEDKKEELHLMTEAYSIYKKGLLITSDQSELDNERLVLIERLTSYSKTLSEESEERERIEGLIGLLLDGEEINLREIELILQKQTDEVEDQESAVNEVIQALERKKKAEDGTLKGLRDEQEARQKLIKQQIEQADRQNKIQKVVELTSTGIQILTSLAGALPTIMDETATGAEKANAAFAGAQGIFGAIGMTLRATHPIIGTILSAIPAIGKGILEITGLWDNVEDLFKSTNEKIEEFNAKLQEADKIHADFANAQSSLEDIADEYERLSEKAGDYGQNLSNMTEEEQKRYHELTDIITSYNKEAIAGYDERGNKIVYNNDLIERTTRLLKEQHDQEMANLYDSETFKEQSELYEKKYEEAKKKLEDLEAEKKEVLTSEINIDDIKKQWSSNFTELQNNFMMSASQYEEGAQEALLKLNDINIDEKNLEENIAIIDEVLEDFNNIIPDDDILKDDMIGYLNGIRTSFTKYSDEINKIEKEIAVAHDELIAASELPTQNILANLKYNTDYNEFYKELEEANINGIDQIIASFVDSLKRGENATSVNDAIAQGKEFTEKLADIFINSDLLKEAQENAIDRADFDSFKEYKEALIKKVNEVFKSNEELQELAQDEKYSDVLQTILSNLFGVNKITFDEDGKFIKNVETATDTLIDQATEKITKVIREKMQGSTEGWKGFRPIDTDAISEAITNLINSGLVTEEDLEKLDYTSSVWDAAADNIISYDDAILKVVEDSKGLKNLEDINNIIDKTLNKEDLSEDELKTLDKLEDKYSELAEAKIEGEHAYLQALRNVREQEEDNYRESLELTRDLAEVKVAKLLENNPKMLIDVEAQTDEFKTAMQELEDADYAVKVQVDADLASDVEDAFGLADEINRLQEIVSQDLKITVDEAREIVAAGYGDILTNAKETSENMILLDQGVVNSFITGKESEIEQDRVAKIKQLESQKELLKTQLNILQQKQQALGDARNADTKEEKQAGLAKAMMLEAEYQAEVAKMNQELQDDAEQKKKLTDKEAELYNTLSTMYDRDAQNFANAARSSDAAGTQLSNNQVSNMQRIFNAAVNVANQVAAMMSGKIVGGTFTYSGQKGINATSTNQTSISNTFSTATNNIEESLKDLTKNFDDSELNNIIDAMQKDTQAQIDQLNDQIGAIDGGIAALKTANTSLEQFKADLGKDKDEKKKSTKSKTPSSSGSKKGSTGDDSFTDGEDNYQDPDFMDYLEAETDIYHDINIILGQIDLKLSRLQKKQEKLVGKDLIKSLEKEAKILEQQKEALENKILLEQIEAETLKKTLKSKGVNFNKDGEISNYAAALQKQEDYVNSIIAKYNSMSKESQEAYKDVVDNAKKDYDNFVSIIERYETIINDEIPDLEDEIQEAYDRQIEIEITKFDMVIQAHLDMSEATREWNEFKKKVIDRVDEDDIKENIKVNLKNLESYFAEGSGQSIQALTKGLQEVEDEIKIINKGGLGNIFGDDEAAAIEKLEDYHEKLMEEMEDIEDLIDDIEQGYLDFLDEANDKFDEQIEGYEYVAEMINHGMNLTKLLYGDEAYEELDKYYGKLVQNNKDNLNFRRQEVQYWKDIMDKAEEGSDAWQKAKENFLESSSALRSELEAAIEIIQEKYDNTINKIIKNFEGSLTNGQALDDIEEQWQMINDEADDYLDTINAAFEVNELNKKYQDAIDNTSSISAQEKLNELRNKEIDMLKQKDKLTEYDVERANLKYQIALKEIALQEAQSNKSKMRLRRDAQGNYSYQYVSDDEQVQDAQDELDALRNSLYNLDKNALKQNQEDILNLEKEYVEKLKELYQKYGKDEEEYNKRREELNAYYGRRINNKLEEDLVIRTNLNESAFSELSNMYQVDEQAFQSMADSEKQILMEQIVPQWKTGISEMIEKIRGEGGFEATTKEMFNELTQAVKTYGEEIKTMTSEAGADVENLDSYINNLIETGESLLSNNDELINKYYDEENAIQELLDTLRELDEMYKEIKNDAVDALEAANKAIQLKNQQTAQTNPGISGSGGSFTSGGNTNGSGGKSPASTSGSNTSSLTDKKPSKGTSSNTAKKGTGNGKLEVGDKVKLKSNAWYYYDSFGTAPAGHYYAGKNSGPYVARIISNPMSGQKKPILLKADGSIDGITDLGWTSLDQIEGYNTGGYTGKWNSKNGKLAVLHEKELVLNSNDTEKMLDIVNVVRGLNDALMGRIASISSGIKSAGDVSNYSNTTSNIQQDVVIHADFPNATSASEIEKAFNNLVNVAAQYAYRK